MVTFEQNANRSGGFDSEGNVTRRFISCCQEELVEVELDALRQGGDRARADGTDALHNMSDIAKLASRACEQALAEQYMPLDEAKFRDVFTLGWCAGYHAEVSHAYART